MRNSLSTVAYLLILVGGVFALGYFMEPGNRKEKKQEIVIHKQDKVAPGMLLHTVRKTSKTWLVDSEGRVKQKWHIRKYVPAQSKYTLRKSPLQHAELAADGSLVAVIKDSAIIRLDKESNLLSKTEGFFHHDIDRLNDGTIIALERKPMEVVYHGKRGTLLNDQLVYLSPTGERKDTFTLFESVAEFVPSEAIEKAFLFSETAAIEDIRNDSPADVLHTNSIEMLKKDIPGIAPKGSLLVSFRELNLVAILAKEDGSLLWHYGPGQISKQHAPTVLPTGTILIFDNGRDKKSSRVIEVEPKNKKIIWDFTANDYDEKKFYTAARGSAQRLSNGNTLISLAERGVAIEVTPEKEIVWKYRPRITLKPDKDGKKRSRQVMMYRIEKIEDERILQRAVG